MLDTKNLVLSENNRIVFARAGVTFPGESLRVVMTRALADLPKNRDLVVFYEIRRTDVPTAFDVLLKLQSTGLARRYIEIDKPRHECREVLHVEVTLMDAIMLALALLLDVILGMLLPSVNASASAGASAGGRPPGATPEMKPYVPTWKRQQRIGYEPFL